MNSEEFALDLPVVAVDLLVIEPFHSVGCKNQVVAYEIPRTCRHLRMKCVVYDDIVQLQDRISIHVK